MVRKITLASMFVSNKQALEKELVDLVLPKDATKIQSIVSNYLNLIFDNEGEYRQNLTQSEDYILQAALSLLQAQQNMAKEVAVPSTTQSKKILEPTMKKVHSKRALTSIEKQHYPYVVAGTAIGSGVGSFLLGTWGAVFGAIAGTAIVLYSAHALLLSQNTSVKQHSVAEEGTQEDKTQLSINIEVFMNIVKSICESVDSLMDTFRSQINRVIDKYESQEKPTLEKEYRFLLEGIQSLLGYKRTHDEGEDKYLKKMQERIEELAELLDNYNLTVIDYSVENINWFEKIPSSGILLERMVFPAVVKNGQVVLKGKIFIPE